MIFIVNLFVSQLNDVHEWSARYDDLLILNLKYCPSLVHYLILLTEALILRCTKETKRYIENNPVTKEDTRTASFPRVNLVSILTLDS